MFVNFIPTVKTSHKLKKKQKKSLKVLKQTGTWDNTFHWKIIYLFKKVSLGKIQRDK